MSSHKKLTKRFSRRNGPRKMLLKGLLVNLIESKKIVTTEAKAKELKRHFDKAVTLAKKQNMNSLRLLVARLSNKDAAKTPAEKAAFKLGCEPAAKDGEEQK